MALPHGAMVFVVFPDGTHLFLGNFVPPRTNFHGCQIGHQDPIEVKLGCHQKLICFEYVKYQIKA